VLVMDGVGRIVEETVSAYGAAVDPDEICAPVGSKLSTIGSVGFVEGRFVGLSAWASRDGETVDNDATGFIVGDEDAGDFIGLRVSSTGTVVGGLVFGFEEGRRVGLLVFFFADGLSVGADDTGCLDGEKVGSTGTGVGWLVVGCADGRGVGLPVSTTAGKPLVGDAEAGSSVAGGDAALDGIVVCLIGTGEGVGRSVLDAVGLNSPSRPLLGDCVTAAVGRLVLGGVGLNSPSMPFVGAEEAVGKDGSTVGRIAEAG